MSETVQIVLIAAGFAALINGIFQLINKLLDNNKEKMEYERKVKEEHKGKKEEVYVAAIGRLLQIRRGFDYIQEEVIRSTKIREQVEQENLSFAEISPKLRLYATDRIFNKYQILATYSRYAYAPATKAPHLNGSSKWAYNAQITLLARLMQEDLGYRKFSEGHDFIQCPNCSTQHDMVSKCPKCGMTFEQYQDKLAEILNTNTELQPEKNSADNIVSNNQQTP
jgi:hypothetical protein